MIIIITIIIVHAEQHFHNHVDNAHLPLIYSNRKCHDRQFFGQAVGSRHLFLWIFMSWIWRKYGICFGQHPWHFFKHLTGWNGISIPTRTDTSNFQGGQRAKASMRGFSVMLGEQEKLPPSAAKWPSMPRMIDTGRCKKGDSSVRTTWSRASIFRSTTISRCLWPSSHKKKGIHPSPWFAMFFIGFIDLLKEDDMKTSKIGRIHRHVWLPGIYPAISTHALRYLA